MQSVLILVGIIIGTAAYVAISGMMLGFQVKLLDQLVNNDANIRISAREDVLTPQKMDSFNTTEHVFWIIPPSGRKDSAKIEYPVAWFDKLNSDPDVVAYSPQVNMNVIFTRNKISYAGRIVGSVASKQIKVTNIDKYMIDGNFKDIGNAGNTVIFGQGLLEKLGARVSETIKISSGTLQPHSFKIVGSFKTGIKSVDDTTAFASLTDVQKIREAGSTITDIAVKIADPYMSQTIAERWKITTLDKVISWEESSSGILSVFKTQDIVRNSMTIAIIVVASFGIYNILSILVNQKKRDIAILRSMGYEPRDIVWIFLNQGLILGIIGGLLGLLVGFIMCKIIGSIEVDSNRMTGSNDGRMIISYNLIIYLKAISIALGSSLLSSILPARFAGKMEPMDIIRSGGQ
ncbi:MAG: FtsX-like permease family protein [Bacteriovoracaceae bacterium]